jgi:hypothetical protein
MLSFQNLSLPSVLLLMLLLCACAPWCSSRRHRQPVNAALLHSPEESGAVSLQNPGTVRSGDVIFISVPFYPFQKIASTTMCPANHVGIVFNDPKKGWIVAESAVPLSRYTPLSHFLARSKGGWCTIRRLKTGLTGAQIAALKAQCDTRMNIAYDTGFDYRRGRLFCSKFVYDVYHDALGVNLGELETFSHLLARNPKADVAFWKGWFFGKIPWQRVTVTPASQYFSPELQTAWQTGQGS